MKLIDIGGKTVIIFVYLAVGFLVGSFKKSTSLTRFVVYVNIICCFSTAKCNSVFYNSIETLEHTKKSAK